MKVLLLPMLMLSSSVFASQYAIETNLGTIEVELFDDKAPISSKNFKHYVDENYYDNTVFHRVIGNFMIQGGGMDKTLTRKKAEKSIQNEADNGLKNKRGTLAMARTNDPHSATSQFFINLKDNTFLDHRSKANGQTWGYAVFGKVLKGMDVVDAIAKVKTTSQKGFSDVPIEPVVIESTKELS